MCATYSRGVYTVYESRLLTWYRECPACLWVRSNWCPATEREKKCDLNFNRTFSKTQSAPFNKKHATFFFEILYIYIAIFLHFIILMVFNYSRNIKKLSFSVKLKCFLALNSSSTRQQLLTEGVTSQQSSGSRRRGAKLQFNRWSIQHLHWPKLRRHTDRKYVVRYCTSLSYGITPAISEAMQFNSQLFKLFLFLSTLFLMQFLTFIYSFILWVKNCYLELPLTIVVSLLINMLII